MIDVTEYDNNLSLMSEMFDWIASIDFRRMIQNDHTSAYDVDIRIDPFMSLHSV